MNMETCIEYDPIYEEVSRRLRAAASGRDRENTPPPVKRTRQGPLGRTSLPVTPSPSSKQPRYPNASPKLCKACGKPAWAASLCARDYKRNQRGTLVISDSHTDIVELNAALEQLKEAM
jgi:hypothetical protein